MTDDEYRDLVERSHQVHELTQHPGWAVLTDYLRFSEGALAFRQLKVLSGDVKSYDDYQRRVGFIEGAQYAIDAPERLTKMIEGERERRAQNEREAE